MVLFQAAAFSFTDSVDYLVSIGVYDVLLPFLLIFSIIFAILEKTKILGANKTNINVIVSVVVGLLLIVQRSIVELINIFLPRVSLMIVVILMGLLVIAMVAGKEFTGLKGTTLGIAIIVIIIAIIIALTSSPSGAGYSISSADRDALLRIGIPLLILFGVIALVTAQPKKENKGPGLLKTIAKEFGGDD
jgi:hypothetical protein